MKLNQKDIDALEHKEKDYLRQVGEPKELYIKVTPKSKIFVLLLSQNGKRNRYTLNKYDAKTFNLAMARDKAIERVKGFNESGIIKQTKQETLNDLFVKWKGLKEKRVANSTMEKDILRLKKHILPKFGNYEVDYFGKKEFRQKLVDHLQSLKKTDIAKRVLGLFKELLSSQVGLGVLDYNPITPLLEGFDTFFDKYESQNYPYIKEPDKLKKLIKGIKEHKGKGKDEQVKYALYVGLLTALRSGNIRSLEWKNIDFDKKLIIIEKDRMKSKREFILPISDILFDILKDWRDKSSNQGRLFKGQNNNGLSPYTLLAAIRSEKKIGFSSNEMVIHSFRATFRTITGEHRKDIGDNGTTNEVLEMCLDHKLLVSSTQKNYDHSTNVNYIDDMREVFNWYANYLYDIESLI